MAGSLNKVTLIGNLGKDPDVRKTQDGRLIVSFSIATTESWKDKTTGEKRDKTEWHNIVIFSEGLAKIAQNYLRKGSKVYIEGQLQTRKWQDAEGRDRYTTEVILQNFNSAMILLDGRSNNNGNNDGYDRVADMGGGSFGQMPASGGSSKTPSFAHELDDDIPF